MKPYYEHKGIVIYHGDCREILPQLERYCEIAAKRLSQEVFDFNAPARDLTDGGQGPGMLLDAEEKA